MTTKESALAQRSSNIFGAPDGKKKEDLLRRKDEYRQELERQMDSNMHYRREVVEHNREHPLESKVERFSVTQRKKNVVDYEPDGEFLIGKEGKSSSEVQRQKQNYQDSLAADRAVKKHYLDHKEENDIKNRKPVQRNHSPVPDGEMIIGAESLENERCRRENNMAFAQGNTPARGKDKRLGEEDHSGFFVGEDASRQLSKKDRKKLQYKQELDQQVDLCEQRRHAEAARLEEEDRYNARHNVPYSGNSQAEARRKIAVTQRQDFLQKASQNFPGSKTRQTSLSSDSKAEFTIGTDNNDLGQLAEKQVAYRHALDEQMDQRSERLRKEKESARRDDARCAEENLPYLGAHDDDA